MEFAFLCVKEAWRNSEAAATGVYSPGIKEAIGSALSWVSNVNGGSRGGRVCNLPLFMMEDREEGRGWMLRL